jgi:hypothetical protein
MSSLFYAALGLLVALILFIWLAEKSQILRDSNPKTLAAGQERPYSLGRCQMAFWLFITVGAFLYIFATTSKYNGVITAQSLVLLGISSGTGLSAIAVDTNKAAAGAAWPVHTSFLMDLLTDVNGVTLHRFQMLIWMIVLGVIYLVAVAQSHTLPAFDDKLLTLLGISSGVYVGFKIPEQQ